MLVLFVACFLVFLIGRRCYRLLLPYKPIMTVHPADIKYKTGDILIFSNSKMVRFVTGERWTHCGVITEINERMYMFEIIPSAQYATLTPVEEVVNTALRKGCTVVYRKLNKAVDIEKTNNFVQRMRREEYSHMTYVEYAITNIIKEVPYLFLPMDKQRHHYYSCCSTLVANFLITAGVIQPIESPMPWDFSIKGDARTRNGYFYAPEVLVCTRTRDKET